MFILGLHLALQNTVPVFWRVPPALNLWVPRVCVHSYCSFMSWRFTSLVVSIVSHLVRNITFLCPLLIINQFFFPNICAETLQREVQYVVKHACYISILCNCKWRHAWSISNFKILLDWPLLCICVSQCF